MVSVKKGFIQKIIKQDKLPAKDEGLDKVAELSATDIINKPILWTREITVGFNRTTGNTREDSFAGSFLWNRQDKHVDEWTLKGNLFYSSTKRKMDRQKWYTMGRYAHSLGLEKKWYNFYRIEADHDRFADIDYRLVPALGIGYWFFDLPEIKLMLEIGGGIESTYFKSDIKNTLEWAWIPRAWLEKELFKDIVLTQGISYYLAFEDFNRYRLRSDTAINIKINNKFKLRFGLLDDYNAKPPEGTKKNDFRAITSLAYSF